MINSGVLLIGISCAYNTVYPDYDPDSVLYLVNTYLYGLVTYQFLVYRNTSMSKFLSLNTTSLVYF